MPIKQEKIVKATKIFFFIFSTLHYCGMGTSKL